MNSDIIRDFKSGSFIFKLSISSVDVMTTDLLLIIWLLVIMIIFYGALLRNFYLGDKKNFLFLKKIAVFVAEIPHNLKPERLKKNILSAFNPSNDLAVNEIIAIDKNLDFNKLKSSYEFKRTL